MAVAKKKKKVDGGIFEKKIDSDPVEAKDNSKCQTDCKANNSFVY